MIIFSDRVPSRQQKDALSQPRIAGRPNIIAKNSDGCCLYRLSKTVRRHCVHFAPKLWSALNLESSSGSALVLQNKSSVCTYTVL